MFTHGRLMVSDVDQHVHGELGTFFNGPRLRGGVVNAKYTGKISGYCD